MSRQISTDFCIAGKKFNNNRNKPIPRNYDEYDVEPEEFFLAENLNFHQNKTRPNDEIRKSKSFFSDRATPKKANLSTIPTMVGLSFISLPEVLPSEDSIPFEDSQLRGLFGSGASLFDGLRPLPDKTNFFPYQIFDQNNPRFILRVFNLDFRDNALEVPSQFIETMYIYMALIRGSKLVSNVIEIEVLPNRETWKPITFDNYDWILAANQEISLWIEAVAGVRVPSNNRPYVIKYTCLGRGETKLMKFNRGKYDVLINPHVPITIRLARIHQNQIEDSEIVVEFVCSVEACPYRCLPLNFVFPSATGSLLECMKKSMMETYDPFYGSFELWNSLAIEPLFFKNLCSSTYEKILYKLINYLKGLPINDTRLRLAIRKLHPATKTIPITNPNSVRSQDTLKTASVRVTNQLIEGNIQPEEKFKPFHTDELRKRLFIQSAASWENL